MHIRQRNRTTSPDDVPVVVDDDPAVVTFTTSVAALSDVWSSMVWLQTTSPSLNAVRREIARWARDTDGALAERFGRSVGSEEIRVLLDSMPPLVPRQVDPADREMLDAAAAEAQQLTVFGREAIDDVTGPYPR